MLPPQERNKGQLHLERPLAVLEPEAEPRVLRDRPRTPRLGIAPAFQQRACSRLAEAEFEQRTKIDLRARAQGQLADRALLDRERRQQPVGRIDRPGDIDEALLVAIADNWRLLP